jgi:hypothetical protein
MKFLRFGILLVASATGLWLAAHAFGAGSGVNDPAANDQRSEVLTGKAAFGDYSTEQPGIFHKITVADLPPPFMTESATNMAAIIPRPADAWPKALPGFKVDLYATGLNNPRLIRTAPNDDVFLAESAPGNIKVFRGADKNGAAHKLKSSPAVSRCPLALRSIRRDQTHNGSTSAIPIRLCVFHIEMETRKRAARNKSSSRTCPVVDA